MEERRKRCLDNALLQLEVDLRLSKIKSMLQSIKIYGFLSRSEHAEVFSESAESNQERVQALVRILKTKEDSAFDNFCVILEKTGQQFLSYGLRGEIWLNTTVRDVTFVKNVTKHLPAECGEGSFAPVVPATWNGIPCMVKDFYVEVENQSKLKKYYFREVFRWAFHLRHRNIVQFYGLLEGREFPSIVMECLETDLEKFLLQRKETPFRVPIILKRAILLDVCHAMVYLHGDKVIHRDLKCSNILLSSSLVAKVSNFGASRIGTKDGIFTNTPGTAEINAPETSTDQYGPEVDVFSFGCVVIQMMSHEFPVPIKVSLSEYERREHLLENINIALYEEFPGLVKRCLQDEPHKRPTFTEIQEELSTKPGVSSQERCRLLTLAPEFDGSEHVKAAGYAVSKNHLQYYAWFLPALFVVVIACLCMFLYYL